MAKVKITGHASGTGVVTVTAPNTSTDRTITLPDETATLSTFNPDAAVVINESGADVDFRVESDTNANGLFFDGGNGNLGVGTASPTNFSGYTTLGVDAATGGLIEIMVGGTRTANIQASATESHIQTRTATPLIFSTNNTERLKLTSDGRGLSSFTAKAWCKMEGTGTPSFFGTPHNCSSITDNGTGHYTLNLTNAMANSNGSAVGNCVAATSGSDNRLACCTVTGTSTIDVRTGNASNGTYVDVAVANIIVFGD